MGCTRILLVIFFCFQKKLFFTTLNFIFVPSSGFTSPALFQSNWAAGTSFVTDSGFSVVDMLRWLTIVLLLGCCSDVVVGFNGCSGLNPKFAANLGMFGFHFSPYNYTQFNSKQKISFGCNRLNRKSLQYSVNRFLELWPSIAFQRNWSIDVALLLSLPNLLKFPLFYWWKRRHWLFLVTRSAPSSTIHFL